MKDDVILVSPSHAHDFIRKEGEDVKCTCKCGAHWSQPESSTDEHLESIFQSHLAYARRAETRVD